MKKYVLALDFGASSGRAILAGFDGEKIDLQEVHRFVNEPLEKDGKLFWNLDSLFAELEIGMQKAFSVAEYSSVGIDTWGVDYAMLKKDGSLVSFPRHYRDSRTAGLSKTLDAATLYARTGIQIMDINTLFQLMSELKEGGLDRCEKILPMPDLFAYLLTGEISAERSMASTTQMLSASDGKWDEELLSSVGIPLSILPPIVESGSTKGKLLPSVQRKLSLPAIPVTAVCGHDTQSAAFAAPFAEGEDALFLSCGTWSLLGAELEKPVLNEQAASCGLSNEVGYGKKVTFLKNIIGLWLIQESRREYIRRGRQLSFAEIETLARQAGESRCFIDPDDPLFTPPGDLPSRIQEYCKQTGQPIPQTVGEIFRCIYESLALKYRLAIEEIERCTNRHFETLHILGGGVKDSLLCSLACEYCERKVVAGPIEATAFGNAAIQLLSLGEFSSAKEARQCIARSENNVTYFPSAFDREKYNKFKRLIRA